MSDPKISIIIGVLNMKDYLPRAIESVLAQNYVNHELIVMDGQSTDGTLDVIKHYEHAITYWISEKDNGHCDACNKALDLINGELILFLNADDELMPDTLREVASTYADNPDCKIISCGVMIKRNDKDSTILINPASLDLTLENMLFELPCINARLFHRSIFSDYGKFQATLPNGSYYISNDRNFLVRLALQEIKTVIIPKPLYIYYSHSNSITFSGNYKLKINEEHVWLAKEILKQNTLKSTQRKSIKTWLARERVWQFYHAMINMNLVRAMGAARLGLQEGWRQWIHQLFSLPIKKIGNYFVKFTKRSQNALAKHSS